MTPSSARPTGGAEPQGQGLRAQGWRLPAVGVAMVIGLCVFTLGVLPLGPFATLLVGMGVLAVLSGCFYLLWQRANRRARGLKDRLDLIEALLEGQPALTLTLTPQGKALSAYGAAPVCLPIEPLFDEGLIEAVHPPDRPAVQAALQKAHKSGAAQVRFTPRLALDLRLSLTLKPLAVQSQPPRLIGVILDASLQQAREEELSMARQEAEAQNLAKSRVLANVSHELRTPLNAVIGFSDIMVQRLFGPLPERYAGYALSIRDAGTHLLDLIGDLLDVSRIEADRYDLTMESLDVREVIASALALVRLGADDKGLSLTAVLPPQPLRVRADRRALKQMTLNLAANAVKFTPPGGSVTVAASALGDVLELVVADTGVGIAPEDLARLGRPFEQAGEAGQRAQGTGLGLSLVRALAELHKGQMTIDSRLGSGTAVTLRLPIIEAERHEAHQPPAQIIPLNRAG